MAIPDRKPEEFLDPLGLVKPPPRDIDADRIGKPNWPPFPPSTPQQDPWVLFELMYTQLKQANQGIAGMNSLLAQLLAKLPGIPPPGATTITVQQGPAPPSSWSAGTPKQIMQQAGAAMAPGTYLSDLIDWRVGIRLAIHVESTLDQPVTLQPVGNLFNAPDKASTMGGPVVLPAAGNTTIVPAFDDWHAFVWLQATVLVQPTRGNLTAWYVIQG